MTPSTAFRRALHFDFHTMPSVPDVGTGFDAEQFTAFLKEAGVEQVNLFARCNLGFAYYPTKIGVVHPGLAFDLFGAMSRAAQNAGASVAAYFNAGLDHEQMLRHRDWCKVDEHGNVYAMKEKGHFFRCPCLNTPYVEHLLGMIREVLSPDSADSAKAAYPVDAIFLDCFHFTPCYGYECLDEMRREGMNPLDDRHVRDYAWRVNERFRDRAIALVNGIAQQQGREISLCFNKMPYRWQPAHIDLEVLPTGDSGYDSLPWKIRYARTLGKPTLMMTGRFHRDWGDFGGLRNEPSLLYDCYLAIAHGGGYSVGDHLHPRAHLEPAVSRLITRVFRKAAELDAWTGGTPLADLVIVYPPLRRYPGAEINTACLAGATRMLSELKVQFDIADHFDSLDRYKVLLLPDDVRIGSKEDLEKIDAFVAKGGRVISSGFSGLSTPGEGEEERFLLHDGALVYHGPETHHPAYFKPAGEEKICGVPDLPLLISHPGAAIALGPAGVAFADLIAPYSNLAGWDGFHEDLYNPPDRPTGRPAAIASTHGVHFAFRLFTGYHEEAITPYRALLGDALRRCLATPLVEVAGLPSYGQVSVTETATSIQVHLLTYLPELRGARRKIIEEPIAIPNVTLRLNLPGTRFAAVYLAPSRECLPTGEKGEVVIPMVEGYRMVVFEKSQPV